MSKRTIDQYWLEERIAIKVEHIPRPTARQLHDALNECLRDFKALYGDFEIVRWPRECED